MDAGEEVSGGLIIAGRNRSVLLELTIEVLHEVARLVQFLVVWALNLSITLGRNDELFSCRKQRLDDAFIGIESLVCQQGVGLHRGTFRQVAQGLLGDEQRKTGWMRAEAAGDPGPWRQQAILGRRDWDADALRDIVGDYVIEHLADDDAVLVIAAVFGSIEDTP